MSRRHVIVPEFSACAQALRNTFDERQRDWSSPHRFAWDYWHVPAQYTYLRTPASSYFPPALFERFTNELCAWGSRMLGCTSIHTCWLSYYIDGCVQELHTDVRHGPWAYTFSLTHWADRRFSGGETRLLRPEVLDYWRSGANHLLKTERRGSGSEELWEVYPPYFNQLMVFDGRIPHSVARVEGTRDPLESRLVLHGWFNDPKLYVTGAIAREHAAQVVDAAMGRLEELLAEFSEADGVLIARCDLDKDGKVEHTRVLTDTLESTAFEPDERRTLVETILSELAQLCFGDLTGPASVTIPIMMQR